jgi:VWFA-related protein
MEAVVSMIPRPAVLGARPVSLPRAAFALAWVVIGFAAAASASQAGSTPSSSSLAQTSGPEIATQESQPSFAIRVQHNEVMLRVVVRDSKGKAITNLRQEDFRIFDRGKLQTITHFSIDRPGAVAGPAAAPAGGTSPPGKPASATEPIILPTRYVGIFFDDIHLEFGDLARTREAAEKYLNSNLKPGDRAGIFTSSGQNQLAFTDDRAKLHEALLKIVPRPLASGAAHSCPTITPYQAYLIDQGQDPTALSVAQNDAISECCGGSVPCAQADANYIENLSRMMLDSTERESLYVFDGLQRLCRVMGTLIGQRSIVMVSPGFLALTQIFQLEQVIDEALRQNVVIGTLDARGLYAQVGLGDASTMVSGNPANWGQKAQWQDLYRSMNGDVLGSIAGETGGTWFHNNNDFVEGFRRAGGLPEAYYVLAFAPQDLKIDGHFHALKVTLADNSDHFSLQTRKGYFAPSRIEDAATVAREELEQKVFSEGEAQPIPLEVRTQFFKSAAGDTRLVVLTHVDVSRLRFRKLNDRNLETLTLVTAVFDRAGDLVNAEQKQVELRLLDATLARLMQSGMSIKSEATVKPGTYLVREVVQDAESDQVSAVNSQVEIP